jgi:hypothetical protein
MCSIEPHRETGRTTLLFIAIGDVKELDQRVSRLYTGEHAAEPPVRQWDEPAWEEVAPGIFCKLMATDTKAHRVSMLVRLLPGVEYPLTRTPGWRNSFSSMASCGSTTANSIPETTTAQRLPPATRECGARLAVRASSSPVLKTSSNPETYACPGLGASSRPGTTPMSGWLSSRIPDRTERQGRFGSRRAIGPSQGRPVTVDEYH